LDYLKRDALEKALLRVRNLIGVTFRIAE